MKKAKLIRILAGFFALMLLFTFLSRAADSVNVAQVEIKTVQNQVITHEVTGTGKVLGTRERAVFTQEGQKVQQVYVQEGQTVKKGDVLLKFSEKYLEKTIKEKQDSIKVLQGKIDDLISAQSVNQQKKNNDLSSAQENYNSAVSSGNYSVQTAQNEAAIARQRLQDYYAQRDAQKENVPDEDKFSDSSEFDDPGNNTSDNTNNSDGQDNSQEQTLIDDIRAKEQAVNDAMISRSKDVQSAGQEVRDAQIGDASDSTLENRQTEVLVEYIKGNSAVYDWQAGGMTKEDPDGCIIDRTAAWELFGNEVAGGQILVQDHIYTVRKVADWGQKILLLGAAQKGEKELSYSRIFIRKRNNKTVQNMVSGFLTKYNLQGTIVSSNLPRIAGFTALLLFPGLVFCCLWREVCREKRKYTIKEAGYWIWNILYLQWQVL